MFADSVYEMVESDKKLVEHRRIYPCRGHYYTIKLPFKLDKLIYPVPESNLKGLGVHLTIDLTGRIRVGPDAEYVDSKTDYKLDETEERREKFSNSLNEYLNLDK